MKYFKLIWRNIFRNRLRAFMTLVLMAVIFFFVATLLSILQLFDRFEALDRESALRLISRNPSDLPRIYHPVFAPELLENTQLLGLALNLGNPVRARLLLKMKMDPPVEARDSEESIRRCGCASPNPSREKARSRRAPGDSTQASPPRASPQDLGA